MPTRYKIATQDRAETFTNKTLTDPLISHVYGSSAANGDLTLEGTSSATKTTSYVVLQPTSGNVGIGTTSPAQKLHVAGVTLVTDKIALTQTDLNEYIDSLADGYMDYGATTAHRFNNPLILSNMKSGATQAGASASAGELWKTASHATLPDNVVMIGV